ncbi:RNA-directed DNA polymerase, eukaryota, reverse transcriptase zinc-binding domain protein [Tanacetum coccineum]
MTWFDLLLKSNIDQNENHILGPSIVAIEKNIKAIIQKDKLTIADLEGVGLERPKQQYQNDVELEYHVDQLKVAVLTEAKWNSDEDEVSKPRSRSDDKEYELSYIDLPRLSLNDVEDMYLLQVQGKLHHLSLEFVKDFNNALLMFIRRVVIQNRVEDIQLGMESYQQTLNLTKPMMFFEGIDQMIQFTMSGTHKGVVYLNQQNIKSFMKLSKVKKFCDGTLEKIRENLVDMVKRNKLGTGNKREKLRRLKEYVGGRPKTVNPRTFVRPIFGFGNKWCSWIKACLNSSRASILINGSPTSEFFIKRGLRQGIHLFSFPFFSWLWKGLHNAFEDAVEILRGGVISLSITLVSPLVQYEVSMLAGKTLSVLGSLGIYYLSIFRAPESVLQDLERIRANFFWGGNKDKNKMAWVKWPIILNSFDKGGLNIGSLKAFNLALLQKWRWRLLSSPNALWVQVIKAYHGQEGGFDTNGCSFKGIWANIVGTSNFLHSKGIILSNTFRFKAGCGTRIRFWKDIWVGETPLFTRYNRLYHLDQDKDCLIIDRINNGQWSWNWSRTNLGVRNLAYLCDMLNEIGQLNIDVNEDTCTWSLGPNGTFTVKDARYRIDQNILPTLAHATTWDKSIPRKVNVFMWRLSLDRLPHRLNLSSRGMDIPAISCPSCNANVESANHVFFECDIATDMWKLVFRWCDIPLFQASSWDSFNDWIISWHASKEKKHRFYVITTSVLWWLWRYRNSVTFNSQPLRKSDLFDNVRFSSFSWLHNRDHMKLSWNDWLMYPLSIARNGNG